MNRLQDKVAVITGGNSGIGFATAQEFIAEGAQVVITGRNAQAVQEAVAQLGPRAAGVASDAASMADLRRLAAQVRAHHPRIDALFVNAGVSFAAPITEVDEAHFDAQFNINVKGAYFTIQQLLPLFNDGGSIILNSSVSAHRGVPSNSVYAATKGAVSALARSLSMDLLDRRIRVNAVSPGLITTAILDKLYDQAGVPADDRGAATESYAQLIPTKHFGTPRDVAQLVTFLASDESSYMLGADVIVGGGLGTV